MKFSRRSLFAATTALAVPHAAFAQEKVVRYGIPMTDIPLTTGQPDRGANAYQYTGLTLYQTLDAIQDLLNCWTGTCTTCHRPLPRTSTSSPNPRARAT